MALTLPPPESECNCYKNLNIAIAKTELNYAGFQAKVRESNNRTYRKFVKQLMKEAEDTIDPIKCFQIIKNYINFFQDKHFQLYFYNNKNGSEPNYIINKDLNALLRNAPFNSIEGLWQNPDNTIEIAILKSNANRQYYGIVVRSNVKGISEGTIYYKIYQYGDEFIIETHNYLSNIKIIARQESNLLRIWNLELWIRVYPFKPNQKEMNEFLTWKENKKGLYFKKLNREFSYLRIPTFSNNETFIKELIEKQDSVIRSTPYFIIDLRNNGGGNSAWIHLIPYLYTCPIYQGSSYLRISEDNVKWKIQDIETFISEPIPQDLKNFVTDGYIKQLKQMINELPKFQGDFYEIKGLTIRLDSINKFPKKVAVIVNDLSGSSTEFFLNLCKQSSKTITFGKNTLGMMDYVGMSDPTILPFSSFQLLIPVTKSAWADSHPIDQIGFEPDINISLSDDKWIDFVMQYLKNKERLEDNK